MKVVELNASANGAAMHQALIMMTKQVTTALTELYARNHLSILVDSQLYQLTSNFAQRKHHIQHA